MTLVVTRVTFVTAELLLSTENRHYSEPKS